MEEIAGILISAAIAVVAVTGVSLTLFLRWAKRDRASRIKTL